MALRLLHDTEGDVPRAAALAAEAVTAVRATRHRATCVTRGAVKGWRAATMWHRALQVFAREVEVRAQWHFVGRFIEAWRNFLYYRSKLRALSEMARERAWASTLAAFFGLWRDGAANSLKGALATVMGTNARWKRLGKGTLFGWRVRLEWYVSLRRMYTFIRNARRTRLRKEAFVGWRAVVEYQDMRRLVRKGATAVGACAEIDRLIAVLDEWRQYARSSTLERLGRVMARRHLVQIVRTTIDVWWGILQARKEDYIETQVNSAGLFTVDLARTCLESSVGDERIAALQARAILHSAKVAQIASALSVLSTERYAKCMRALEGASQLAEAGPPAGPQPGTTARPPCRSLKGIVWYSVDLAASLVMYHVATAETRMEIALHAWFDAASVTARKRRWRATCLLRRMRPVFAALASIIVWRARVDGLAAKASVALLVDVLAAWHDRVLWVGVCNTEQVAARRDAASKRLVSTALKGWGDLCTTLSSLRIFAKHMWAIAHVHFTRWASTRLLRVWRVKARSERLRRRTSQRPAVANWRAAVHLGRLCRKVEVHLWRYATIKWLQRWKRNIVWLKEAQRVLASLARGGAGRHFREWRRERRVRVLLGRCEASLGRLVAARWRAVRPRGLVLHAVVATSQSRATMTASRRAVECWRDFAWSRAIESRAVKSAKETQCSHMLQAWSNRAMVHRVIGFCVARHSTGVLHVTLLCWARLVRCDWEMALRGIRMRGMRQVRAFKAWYTGMLTRKSYETLLGQRLEQYKARAVAEWAGRARHKRILRALSLRFQDMHRAHVVWTAYDALRLCTDAPEDPRGRWIRALSRRVVERFDCTRLTAAWAAWWMRATREAALRRAWPHWTARDFARVWLAEFFALWRFDVMALRRTLDAVRQLASLSAAKNSLRGWGKVVAEARRTREAGLSATRQRDRVVGRHECRLMAWCFEALRQHAASRWRRYLAGVHWKANAVRESWARWSELSSLEGVSRELRREVGMMVVEESFVALSSRVVAKHLGKRGVHVAEVARMRLGFSALASSVKIARQAAVGAAALRRMASASLALWATACWRHEVVGERKAKGAELAARIRIPCEEEYLISLLRSSKGSVVGLGPRARV